MTPALAIVAVAITIGAVLATGARETRTALFGVAVALVTAPFLADPFPLPLTLAARVVGAALAAYLLRAAATSAVDPSDAASSSAIRTGSPLGWPAEGLFATIAWVVGLNIAAGLATLTASGPTGNPLSLTSLVTPSGLAAGSGLALIVVGLVPAIAGSDELRAGIGALILIQGVILFGTGVAGAPGDLEQLATVALLVGAAIATSMIVSATRRGPSASASRAGPGVRSGVADPADR
jgi:hypothetical protein